MKSIEETLRYLMDQLVKYGATANTYGRDLADRIQVRCDGDDVAVDNDLRGNLLAGVGENKSLRWYARHLGDESCEDIAQDTYNTSATVEDTIQLVADYIEQEVDGPD